MPPVEPDAPDDEEEEEDVLDAPELPFDDDPPDDEDPSAVEPPHAIDAVARETSRNVKSPSVFMVTFSAQNPSHLCNSRGFR
jgi:hypothetical protein